MKTFGFAAVMAASMVVAAPAEARFSQVFGPLKSVLESEITSSIADPICLAVDGKVSIQPADLALISAAVDGIDI